VGSSLEEKKQLKEETVMRDLNEILNETYKQSVEQRSSDWRKICLIAMEKAIKESKEESVSEEIKYPKPNIKTSIKRIERFIEYGRYVYNCGETGELIGSSIKDEFLNGLYGSKEDMVVQVDEAIETLKYILEERVYDEIKFFKLVDEEMNDVNRKLIGEVFRPIQELDRIRRKIRDRIEKLEGTIKEIILIS